MILSICTFSILALICTAMAENTGSSTGAGLTVLKQDSGKNITNMSFVMYSLGEDWGLSSLFVGEAVKFTAPKKDWKMKQIRVLGWNGYNETNQTVPSPIDFLVEVRDADLNLLYRLSDTQNAYFTYPVPALRGIDIPALNLNGEFYIIFYDRGYMQVGAEVENGTGNSYIYNSVNGEMIPAEFRIENAEPSDINWVIRAVGE